MKQGYLRMKMFLIQLNNVRPAERLLKELKH